MTTPKPVTIQVTSKFWCIQMSFHITWLEKLSTWMRCITLEPQMMFFFCVYTNPSSSAQSSRNPDHMRSYRLVNVAYVCLGCTHQTHVHTLEVHCLVEKQMLQWHKCLHPQFVHIPSRCVYFPVERKGLTYWMPLHPLVVGCLVVKQILQCHNESLRWACLFPLGVRIGVSDRRVVYPLEFGCLVVKQILEWHNWGLPGSCVYLPPVRSRFDMQIPQWLHCCWYTQFLESMWHYYCDNSAECSSLPMDSLFFYVEIFI